MNIQTFHSSSRGNLYRISDGDTALLIDPGVRMKQIKKDLDFKLSEIAGCLCSHSHADHSRAVADLTTAGVDVYLTRGTLDALEANGHRFYTIRPGKQFQIDTWSILPFETIHNCNDSVGFLLVSGSTGVKLLYAIDTQYIKHRFNGLTHIMIECNYDVKILRDNVRKGLINIDLAKDIIRNHMSLETAKGFFQANDMSRIQEIHLLHLSHNNSGAEMFKQEIQKITGRPVYIGGNNGAR